MNKIDIAWETYYKEVCDYAEQRFNSVIKPYLEKRGWEFISGNGTYWIGYDDPEAQYGFVSIDIDKLPERIRDTLQMEVQGLNQDLGTLMPDFRKNKKESVS